MKADLGMTKQGVRNLNNLGPKRAKPVAATPALADGADEAQANQAPAQPLPPPPVAVTESVASPS